jgi:hypothetical protein
VDHNIHYCHYLVFLFFYLKFFYACRIKLNKEKIKEYENIKEITRCLLANHFNRLNFKLNDIVKTFNGYRIRAITSRCPKNAVVCHINLNLNKNTANLLLLNSNKMINPSNNKCIGFKTFTFEANKIFHRQIWLSLKNGYLTGIDNENNIIQLNTYNLKPAIKLTDFKVDSAYRLGDKISINFDKTCFCVSWFFTS